jgi:hypothetical protein
MEVAGGVVGLTMWEWRRLAASAIMAAVVGDRMVVVGWSPLEPDELSQ